MADGTLSLLADLRDVPLDELDGKALGKALERIFPEGTDEPDAAFQSAI